MGESSTTKSFDSNACTKDKPCCVDAEDSAKYLGSVMGKKVFCHIEYPVKTEQKWTKKHARTLDDEARKEYEEQLKTKGCGLEECTGYVCAKKFPRCFYVNQTTMGEFEFEVCRETCEACLGHLQAVTEGLLCGKSLPVSIGVYVRRMAYNCREAACVDRDSLLPLACYGLNFWLQPCSPLDIPWKLLHFNSRHQRAQRVLVRSVHVS